LAHQPTKHVTIHSYNWGSALGYYKQNSSKISKLFLLEACYPPGALLSSTNSGVHTATEIQFLYSIELLQEIIQLIVPYYMLQLNLIESTNWL
jgi:hypothetical protein